MIVRNIVGRHGRRALAAPALRSCHRTIQTSSLVGEITPEQIEEFNRAAAINQVPVGPGEKRKHIKDPIGLKQKYKAFLNAQEATDNIGSKLGLRYVPSRLIRDPPEAKDISLELLMASQTHMGHHTSRWNPANSRYIYGVRQGIHIISLETTAAHLRRAARVVEEVSYRGGLILFVGTRKGQMQIVTKAAKLAGAYHLFTKWTPGNITNRDLINRGKGIKVVDEKDMELKGFERFQRNSRPLIPDLVVCLNPLENYTMLYECGLANVPTIGIIDTDANPDWVTYTIPANDDSWRSVAVIGGVLGRAGQKGRERRLAAAENGVVEWETPIATRQFMDEAISRHGLERKRWMWDNTEETEKGGEARLLEMVQAQRARFLGEEMDDVFGGDNAPAAAPEVKKSVKEQLLLDDASQAERRMRRAMEAEEAEEKL